MSLDALLTPNSLLVVAAFALVLSLALAWLASLIVYAKIGFLKRCFPATHQLIRAHIDYLLMCMLLVVVFYLAERLALVLPSWVISLLCIGAIYNPLGFIVLAVKPKMANPQTLGEKARVLLGFIPATLGFGYVGIAVMVHLI
ncbi:MAG: hypothetical protein R3183_08865 [Oleiphilaceae bacterium]|nr:hypothetical protein [Oleiphilaceae bacterium]